MPNVKQYKSKPKLISALEITNDNFDELKEFAGKDVYMKDNKPYVQTLEGSYELKKGWFLIKGIAGEFYPCEPEIFSNSYIEIFK